MSVQELRVQQAVAWVVAGLFVVGFFSSTVGMWTGPVLGVWFVGTQRPVRGLTWMVALNWVPWLGMHLGQLAADGVIGGVEVAFGMLVAAVVGALPFTFHRLVSGRLPGLAWTLPLPLAVLGISVLARWLPLGGEGVATGLGSLVTCWTAAVVVWLWNREAPALVYGMVAGVALLAYMGVALLDVYVTAEGGLGCVAGCAVLALWAVAQRRGDLPWTGRAELALLRCPVSRSPIRVRIEVAGVETGREVLVSDAGERFPIHGGIPNFLQADDLTGLNRKYNQLYETIAGFYDDSQRVGCALSGMDRDTYVRSYLGRLEVKAGDRVLETSVGTGLNFKYLPREIERWGLDLSEEMLARCQENLRRWEMSGSLFAGNAEVLPFADESFDVVFHVGGINFFSDRGKAIREMMRVAKPGSLLLIADETEKHVKNAFEKIPYTSGFFKGRTETVAAPVDLLPAEAEDVRLETVFDGRFYALTFRKPGVSGEDGEALSGSARLRTEVGDGQD